MKWFKKIVSSPTASYFSIKSRLEKSDDFKKWIAELRKTPKEEWARIYCELNSHKLPKELLEIKPIYYDERDNDMSLAFTILIMEYIEKVIGEFTVSQYHCCNNLSGEYKMTKEEHIEWFLNHKVVTK